MTRSLTHKQRTHARILDEAASVMRIHGSEGISVAKLMERAGLTHGGFYAHFDSRDDLVAHALDRMFQDSRSMLEDNLGSGDVSKGISNLIDTYLSDRVRRSPERGCPLPALIGEASRMRTKARARFNKGISFFLRTLTVAFDTLGKPQPESLASSVLAEMIGAMSLARATNDENAAHEILEFSRRSLKERLGLGLTKRP
jgi:TetR/AcrR family transcriptional regulator, transcriptional repressor for nem operon